MYFLLVKLSVGETGLDIKDARNFTDKANRAHNILMKAAEDRCHIIPDHISASYVGDGSVLNRPNSVITDVQNPWGSIYDLPVFCDVAFGFPIAFLLS